MNVCVMLTRKMLSENVDELLNIFLKEKHIVAVECGNPLNPSLYLYDGSRYVMANESDVKNELNDFYREKFPESNNTPDLNSMLSKLRRKLHKMSVDGFFRKENGIFRIPGMYNDLIVNGLTGELNVVEKDPDHYPSLIALPYDFTHTPPANMPEELDEFLSIAPPKFRDALLFELTSPLSFEPQLFVNYIADDDVNFQIDALNTINGVFGALYGNYIAWRSFNTSNIEFQYDNAYHLDSLVVLVYTSGKARKLAEFVKSPVITARYSHKTPFNVTNRFPVVMNADNYEYMPEFTLLKDAIIIPIIDTVLGKRDNDDPWRVRNIMFWNDEVKENIVLWLIHNMLSRYLKNEHRKYIGVFSQTKLLDWEEHKNPDFGWSEFVDRFIYKADESSSWSVYMTIEDAYKVYLEWGYGKYMPLSYNLFKQAIRHYMKDGKVCLYKPSMAKIPESHLSKTEN